MKNSTKRDSSSIPGVRGILFFKRIYEPMYATVEAWVKAGKPPNCFVYDGVHQLLSHRIPIADAVEVEGRWIRTEAKVKCPPTKYRHIKTIPKKRVKTSTIELKTSDFMTPTDSAKRKLR